MKQKVSILLLVLGAMLTLTASNLEADFIQCIGAGTCDGTEFGDVINGTPDLNEIGGFGWR